MDLVVPWAALVERSSPVLPSGKNGRPPFELEAMLRIHCMQQWFTLSDLAMEEAFGLTPRSTGSLPGLMHMGMPDESTILVSPPAGETQAGRSDSGHRQRTAGSPGLAAQGRHCGGCHLDCSAQLTKNKDKKRDPEMHFEPKGNGSGTLA